MTGTFENYVCWNRTAANSALTVDAASLPVWLFNAVHHPLMARRRRLEDKEKTGGEWVKESDVVDALRGDLRGDGYLIIPVVGNAGTGKSHLVKWVYGQTKDTPDWNAYYLPKNRTGLKQVIEILSGDLEESFAKEVREELDRAPAEEAADEKGLGTLLIDRIAYLLEQDDERTATAATGDDRAAKQQKKIWETTRKELPNILRTKVTREAMTGEGGVIPRLISQAGGRQQESEGLTDDDVAISKSDLPLVLDKIDDADPPTKETLNKWAGSPAHQDAAVGLINQVLQPALRHTFLGQFDFTELFREVRRNIEGELVLFIEDLTVLHGVSLQFLSAITEPNDPNPDDPRPMCGLRVILAVTEGYFDAMATVSDRCEHAYWLESTYGSNEMSSKEAISFLGRYLNAVRQDTDALEKKAKRNDVVVGNHCSKCPHTEDCHLAFKTSAEGYGLYPFTSDAAGNFVASRSGHRFDPREIVRGLRDFLEEANAQLGQSTFPSGRIEEEFGNTADTLEARIINRLGQTWPSNEERAGVLVRYWSSGLPQFDDEGQLTLELQGEVLAAFGLDPSNINTTVPGEDDEEEEEGEEEKEEELVPPGRKTWDSQLSAKWRDIVTTLDSWASGDQTLGVNETRDLRELVHDTIRQNLFVGLHPMYRQREHLEKRFNRDHAIGFEGSATKLRENRIVTIDRSIDNCLALQGLIRLREVPNDHYPDAELYRTKAATKLEEWSEAVVPDLFGADPDGPVIAVQWMLLAAVVAGNCGECSSPADYAQKIFLGPPDPDRASIEEREKKWVDLARKTADRFENHKETVLAELGETRSEGSSISVIDASLLIEMVRELVEDPELESVIAKMEPLVREFKKAVDTEWSSLRKRASNLDLLDLQTPFTDQVDRFMEVLVAAGAEGKLPPGDDSLIRDLETLKLKSDVSDNAHVHNALFELAGLDEADMTLLDKAKWVAGTDAVHVRRVGDHTERTSKKFEEIENGLPTVESNDDGKVPSQQIVSRVLQALSSLLESTRGPSE